ncbi:hypothetical protein CLOSYM_03846, partial [[Clostridium] symbiosum ATCC 14940]
YQNLKRLRRLLISIHKALANLDVVILKLNPSVINFDPQGSREPRRYEYFI